jgi:malate synthase
MKSVEKDKIREVTAGHDGTWVAHPALVKVARDVFDEYMKTPQSHNNKDEMHCLNFVGMPHGSS